MENEAWSCGESPLMEQIGRGRGLLVGPNVESDEPRVVLIRINKAGFGSRSTWWMPITALEVLAWLPSEQRTQE